MWSIQILWDGGWVTVQRGFASRDDAEWAIGKWKLKHDVTAAHWLKHHGWMQDMTDEVRTAALQWSLLRGSRSGRVAGQFARDWCGQHVQR
jgi:hypothetical protein